MTAALWVDLILLVLLVAGAVAGWRRGGLGLAGSVAGLVAGLLVGLAVVPLLTDALTGTAWWVVTGLGVLVAGLLGSGLGGWLGGLLTVVLARLHLGLLDRVAGAVGGLLLAFVLIGIAFSLLSAGPGPGPAGDWLVAARTSALGSAATSVADQALELVRSNAPVGVELPAGLTGGMR